jgi:phosphoglucomutase/phosphopentomutase
MANAALCVAWSLGGVAWSLGGVAWPTQHCVLHGHWEVLHGHWEVLHGHWEVLHGHWEVLHGHWEVLHGQRSSCGHSWTASGCLALQLARLDCCAVIINLALSTSYMCHLILLYVLHNACMVALIVTLMARATTRKHRSTVQTLTALLNITYLSYNACRVAPTLTLMERVTTR